MARGTMEPRPAVTTRAPMTRSRASFAVEVDSRTAWDFLISAGVGDHDERDLGPADRAWLDHARASLAPEQRAALDAGFGGESASVFHGLPMLVAQDPTVRSASDVVDLLGRLEPRDLVESLLSDCLTGELPTELIERVMAGDRAAIDEVEPALCDEGAGDALRRFMANPRWAMDLALAVARSWRDSFQEIEPRLARIHAADAAMRVRELGLLPADEVIERATGGFRFLPDTRVRRVVLGPSVFARPFNIVYQGPDWRLFCYPVADEMLDVDDGTPSAAMIRLFRALGDPTRLQVLRLLTTREWYLTELATQLELSKPTMKHHLAMLRAAGLVTVIEEGNLTYYRLRRERLDEGGSELRRYLA